MPIPIKNLTVDYSIQPLTLTLIQIYCPEGQLLPDGKTSQFITCSATGWTVPALCAAPVIIAHDEDSGVVLDVAHSMLSFRSRCLLCNKLTFTYD